MEYIPVRVSDIIRQANRDIFVPAIQREFVWGTDRIERLFDSIMADFPIGSFLYWQLEQKNKDEWPVYEFIRDFDDESPHNSPANMAGITKDIPPRLGRPTKNYFTLHRPSGVIPLLLLQVANDPALLEPPQTSRAERGQPRRTDLRLCISRKCRA